MMSFHCLLENGPCHPGNMTSNSIQDPTRGRACQRKEALAIGDQARERGNTATASRNQCLGVHFKFIFCRSFLGFISCHSKDCYSCLHYSYSFVLSREGTQELIEFCKVNEVF